MTADETSQRYSRFHCQSQTPPSLRAVLREIGKRVGKRGYLEGKGVVRGITQQVDAFYNKRGKADDLVRFLLNTVVLLEDPSNNRLYYYRDRGQHILDCCERHAEPSPLEFNKDALFALLRDAGDKRDQVPQSKPLTVPFAEVMRGTLPSQPRSEPMAEQPPAKSPAKPPKTNGAKDAAEQAEQAEQLPQPRYCLYLDPFEQSVWNKLTTLAKVVDGALRVGVPRDPDERHCKWVDGSLCCTAEEYAETFAKFVDAKIIEQLAPSGNGHEVFRFVHEPAAYFIEPISGREEVLVTVESLELIQAVQSVAFVIPAGQSMIKAFDEWFAKRYPGRSVASAKMRIIGYRPKYHGEHSWGILRYAERGTTPLRCVKGFESFKFVDRVAAAQEAALPAPAKRPTRPPSSPPTAVQPHVTPAPVMAPPDTDQDQDVPDRHSCAIEDYDHELLMAMTDAEFEEHLAKLRFLKKRLPAWRTLADNEAARRLEVKRQQEEMAKRRALLQAEVRQHEETAQLMRDEIAKIEAALAKSGM